MLRNSLKGQLKVSISYTLCLLNINNWLMGNASAPPIYRLLRPLFCHWSKLEVHYCMNLRREDVGDDHFLLIYLLLGYNNLEI